MKDHTLIVRCNILRSLKFQSGKGDPTDDRAKIAIPIRESVSSAKSTVKGTWSALACGARLRNPALNLPSLRSLGVGGLRASL
jgi:hypothetical protein